MRGKLIVIEGTDCSGKETQANNLITKLLNDNVKVSKFSFPNYDSPTGKIVGGPYLGKSYICSSWFEEGAANVDPKVASLYYAADRIYNIKVILDKLESGENVLLDRYFYSNMAHQAGKIDDKEARSEMYDWLEKLECKLLGLPQADIRIFLHMPYENSLILKQIRKEPLDELEKDKECLIKAEMAYIELAQKYDFYTIECVGENGIRTIQDISNELYHYVKEQLN